MSRRQPLGQNFLNDPAIAARIVDLAAVAHDQTVLEIGPGHGALTEGLLSRAGKLIALEVDQKLCHILHSRFGANPHFRLERADALKTDYSAIGPKFKVVSNLPYYIATPILKRLIHYRARITDMTLMMQKEVADRILAAPGTRDYGSLTVFVQYYCAVERLLEVDPECFRPPPKVRSTVLRVTPLPRPSVTVSDEDTFFKIVTAAFFHKRKMLKNNLKSWNDRFTVAHNKTELAGVDLNRRGETLSLDDFAAVANFIHTAP